MLRPAAILLVAALPGIVPAAAILGGASPSDVATANYLQVFWRLRHHLDPTEFSAGRYAGYLILFLAWLCLTVVRLGGARSNRKETGRFEDGNVRWPLFVTLTVVIAIAGVIIGWHSGSAWHMPLRNIRVTLLKFYPFRLADVFIPLAISLSLTKMLAARWNESVATKGLAAFATVAAFVVAVAIPLPDRNPSRLTPERLAAWQDVADWAREDSSRNSSRDAQPLLGLQVVRASSRVRQLQGQSAGHSGAAGVETPARRASRMVDVVRRWTLLAG